MGSIGNEIRPNDDCVGCSDLCGADSRETCAEQECVYCEFIRREGGRKGGWGGWVRVGGRGGGRESDIYRWGREKEGRKLCGEKGNPPISTRQWR